MKSKSPMRNIIFSIFIPLLFSAAHPAPAHGSAPLEVDVWLDRGNGAAYNPDDAIIVYFEANRPSYVVVYGIDTDGYVHILYPYYPGMDNYVAGHQTYSIPGGGFDMALYVDEPVGMGYVEAVASEEPFLLDDWPFMSRHDETVERVEMMRRVSGDRFLSMEEINRGMLSISDDLVYDDDFAVYYVEEIPDEPAYASSNYFVGGYYYDPYSYSYPSFYVSAYDYWYCDDFWYWGYYSPFVYYYPHTCWAYYSYPGPYEYYDWYYYSEHSRGEPRYNRKYDYTDRDNGSYRSKVETPLTANSVRTGGSAEENEFRFARSKIVAEEGQTGLHPSFEEKSTVREASTGDQTIAKSSVVNENRGWSEAVARKADAVSPGVLETRPRVSQKVAFDYGNSTSRVTRIEKKRVSPDRSALRLETPVKRSGSVGRGGGERTPVARRSTVVHEGRTRRETEPLVDRRPAMQERERPQRDRDDTVRRETRSGNGRPARGEVRRSRPVNSRGSRARGAVTHGSGSGSRGAVRGVVSSR